MILHLIDDYKFASKAYDLFEEYYSGLNHFFIQVSRHQKITQDEKMDKERFFSIAFTNKQDINYIIQYAIKNKIKHILVHNLTPTKAALANLIKKKSGAKTYWIFYGSDLYGYLSMNGKYKLYDNPAMNKKKEKKRLRAQLAFFYLFGDSPNNAYKKFINRLEYFCFWNEYDYTLLKQNFKTNAVHKQFLYYGVIDRDYINVTYAKNIGTILINHSASANGNHTTVLEKLSKLTGSENINQVIAPLSYGSEQIKSSVSEYGKRLFDKKFISLKQFVPVNEYYSLLNNIPAAIFGNRRQEGGGNVFYLLGKGTKVFLRNDNNMLQWLRDRNFLVFSFEDDLNAYHDLEPLEKKYIQQNMAIHAKVFSKENEIKTMNTFIESQ